MQELTENPQPIEGNAVPVLEASAAVERHGVQNEGGFLTPYYMYELLERQHADELDPEGRDAARYFLRGVFQRAQRALVGMVYATISLEYTWTHWYHDLFRTLGFSNLRRLTEPLDTASYGLVPISYACFAEDAAPFDDPLILVDLHPFGTDLDRASYPKGDGITTEPISRALEMVLDQYQTKWALLSNGLELRLYRRASTVARQYLKVDFVTLFSQENRKDWLVFWGLFRLAAFLTSPAAPSATPLTAPSITPTDDELITGPRCLLETVIEESQRHATKIADDLRDNIVSAVESLLQGVIDSPLNQHRWQGMLDAKPVPDEAQLKTLFEESVYFLYRLLFILYAESRDLLPIGESPIYREGYSLEHLRKMAYQPLRPEDYSKTYYIETLRTLFTMLYKGYPPRNPAVTPTARTERTEYVRSKYTDYFDEPEQPERARSTVLFRIPPYNGRLFDPERTKLLNECHIPDRAMREVVRELSLSRPQKRYQQREPYSYADLGVDQLGSVYEGLLVYEPSIAAETLVEVRIKNEVRLIPLEQADEYHFAYDDATKKPKGSFVLRIWGGRRKGSGSYYTPQEITAFLVKDALAPLVEPIIAGCAQRDEEGQPLRRADELLKLKVCDPAMGSGAFLVQACRYLGEAYGRAIIAEEGRTTQRVSSAELARYKRRVAESCLYGVDLNPLAVELAKVSLWLETLAADRPLSFLDAHLRCGNALIGAPLRNARGQFDTTRLNTVQPEAFGKASKEDTNDYRVQLKKLTDANRKQLKALLGNKKATQLVLFGSDEEQEALAYYEQQRILMEESDEEKSLEDAVALVHYKQELLRTALTGEESQVRRFKQFCDLWCATWFWPLDADVPAPTTLIYRELAGLLLHRPGVYTIADPAPYFDVVRKLADEEMRFFHWELEFPEIWCDAAGNALPNGGFDVIVGNPPWEGIAPKSKEFWSNYLPLFRALGKQAALESARELRVEPEIDTRWRKYLKLIYQQSNIWRLSRLFSEQEGQLNTYKLFAEQMVKLTKVGGICSLVIPSGIYTDEQATDLRRLLFFQQASRFVLSLENRGGIFPMIHRSTKIVLLSVQKNEQEAKQQAKVLSCLFLVGKDSAGLDLAPASKAALGLLLPQLHQRLLQVPTHIVRKLAPNTLSLLEFKSQQEIDLIAKIYAEHPLLGKRLEHTWNVVLRREFDMTNDSPLFKEQPGGWPLWEGKMIYQFTCEYRQPRYWVDGQRGTAELAGRYELKNYQIPAVWVADEPKVSCANFRLVYRDVARGTDEKTLIFAVLPPHTFTGHTLTILMQWEYLFREENPYWVKYLDEANELFLLAVLNSFVLNFVIRSKVTAHVSMYLLNQLPVPRLPAMHPVSQALVPLAARLTCVDERFAPLWEEVAHHHPDGMAARWTPECAAHDAGERAGLRAEIDALVADLYGLSAHDYAYILSTFPLLDRDQPALPGESSSFITRDLALLTLLQRRGLPPPTDIVAFFQEAGVDLRQRTGPIVDLAERVHIARELGAVAYQPSGRERSNDEGDNEEEEEAIEQDESDFDNDNDDNHDY